MPIAWRRILQSNRRKGRHQPIPPDAPFSTEPESSLAELPRLHTPEWQRQLEASTAERPVTPNPANPTNPFICLPPDLIFTILDHCDVVSVLSLRLSSRTFYNIIPVPTAVPLQRNVLSRLIKRDVFQELCLKDDTNTLPESKVLCSACLTSHLPFLFTTSQLTTPSRRRLCRGIEYRVILCRHKTLSFDEARIVPRLLFACQHPEHAIPFAFSSPPQYLKRPDGLSISTVYDIFDRDREQDPPLTNEAFALQVKNDPRFICPHMQIHDVLLPSLFSKLNFKDGGTYDSLTEEFFRNSHRCMAVDCQTKFRFRRNGQGQTDSYDLLVTRTLGNLNEPTDKHWLAQVQPLDTMWTWGRRRPSDATRGVNLSQTTD